MKKSLRSLLAFLIAATVLCCIAMADTGPKPSASFTFTGMPDEDYYVTMLSRVDTYGPHRVHQPGVNVPCLSDMQFSRCRIYLRRGGALAKSKVFTYALTRV